MIINQTGGSMEEKWPTGTPNGGPVVLITNRYTNVSSATRTISEEGYRCAGLKNIGSTGGLVGIGFLDQGQSVAVGNFGYLGLMSKSEYQLLNATDVISTVSTTILSTTIPIEDLKGSPSFQTSNLKYMENGEYEFKGWPALRLGTTVVSNVTVQVDCSVIPSSTPPAVKGTLTLTNGIPVIDSVEYTTTNQETGYRTTAKSGMLTKCLIISSMTKVN